MKEEYKEKISKKFSDLKIEGREILKNRGWNGESYVKNHPDDIDYKSFEYYKSCLR